MAASTLAVGLLPGHESIGIAAPILFALMRILQGLFLSDELPGAMVLITESLPKRRGLACVLFFVAVSSGILLGQAVHWLLVQPLPAADMADYGWRLAFLFSGLAAFIGYLLRARLVESPAFASLSERAQRIPALTLLRKHWRHCLAGLLIAGQGAATASLLFLFMNISLTALLKYPAETASSAGLIAVVVFMLPMPLAGWLGDRYGLHWPAMAGTLLLGLAALPLYGWMQAGAAAVWPALALLSLAAGLAYGAATGLLSTLFPADVRYFRCGPDLQSGLRGRRQDHALGRHPPICCSPSV